MKRILIFTFSLLFEDCIFSINSIFYTHNYTILKKTIFSPLFLRTQQRQNEYFIKTSILLIFYRKNEEKTYFLFSKAFFKSKKTTGATL